VPRRSTPKAVAKEIDDQTELGAVYVRSLLSAQLRLSMGILVILGLGVGALPLLFSLAPELMGHTVLGMPLAWGGLGFGVYPALLFLGWFYLRRAERHERSIAELVER